MGKEPGVALLAGKKKISYSISNKLKSWSCNTQEWFWLLSSTEIVVADFQLTIFLKPI